MTEIALPSDVRVGQATAVEQARAVAEVAAAVRVAQMNPRDMNRAWAEMEAACARLGLAERAFYAVVNRGRGPSVHLARELARIWGNLDYGVHELHRDDERGISEVRAYAWDQQTNVRSSRTLQVPHQRMVKDKEGKPARKLLVDLGDVYLNNQNIGARAVREAIFTVMPADFVAKAQEVCQATIKRGDGKPLPERIQNVLVRFKNELGVTVDRIEARVGRTRGQWTAADLAELAVVFSSIARGETRVEDEFPDRVTAAEITGGPRPDQPAAQTPAVPAPSAAPAAVTGPEDDEGWPEAAKPGSGARGERNGAPA
jgi:hypothetical protein